MSKKYELRAITDNRVYKIVFKKSVYNYCLICQKRAGSFYADCSPGKVYGVHGSGKKVYSYKYRRNRSWKNYRNNQWK
jgi:hypothetical protein